MSVFKVNPRNQLGLEFQKTKSKLLSLALSKPEDYFTLRANCIEKITESSVQKVYDDYWNLLTEGLDPNSDQIKYPNGDDFVPNLPEATVNKFCLKVASAIRDIAEEAIEEILPMEFQDLARNKQKELLKVKGL